MTPLLEDLVATSDLVKKAHAFASKAHEGQVGKTGHNYFDHLKAVAEVVADWDLGEESVAAALLHSVLDRTPHTVDSLKKNFGDEVASLVDGGTTLKNIAYQGVYKDLENLRKLILHLSKDVRAVLIQLACRHHFLKHSLPAYGEEVQRRVSLDTLEIHAPIAYRLGMYKLAGEMEDLAFPCIYPKEYVWIIENLQELYEEREAYAKKFKELAEELLLRHNLKPVDVHYRAKRYSSLYKKLLRYDMDIKKIYDLVALRIIVTTIPECYQTLELIHNSWKPTVGFDDYIAHPKPNGYQSLHTNVVGPKGKIIEIQIRTAAMHEEAERGAAARFAYEKMKEEMGYLKGEAVQADASRYSWIKKLVSWQRDPKANSKVDIFSNTILVLSPLQDIVELPKGATALDFAYKIHSTIGNHATGVLINSKPAKLSSPLQFADIVEVKTSNSSQVNAERLKLVTTPYAKAKINEALNTLKESETLPLLKTEISFFHKQQSSILSAVLKYFGELNIPIEKVTMETRRSFTGKYPAMRILCAPIPSDQLKNIVDDLNCIAGVEKATARSVKISQE